MPVAPPLPCCRAGRRRRLRPGGGDDGATLRVDIVATAGDGAVARAIAAPPRSGWSASTARARSCRRSRRAGGSPPTGAASSSACGRALARRQAGHRGRRRRLASAASPRRRAATRGRPLLAALANGAAVLRGPLPPTALGIDAPVDNVVEVRAAGAMPGLLAAPRRSPTSPSSRAGPRPPPLGPFRVADPARRPITLTRNPRAGERDPPREHRADAGEDRRCGDRALRP